MEQKQLRFPGFPEKPEENYWQYPRICNGWWHLLSGSEQKVLDYILRHTWGYRKTSDKISLSQFQKGITNKTTGEEVDKGIGIKRKDVILKAIKRLEEMGFIRTLQKAGKTKEFQLVTNGDTSGHQRGQVASHQSGHTIEDVTIEDRTIELATPSVAGSEINLLIELFKQINPTYERLFSNKTQRQALERLVRKFGSEKVKRILEVLPKTFGKLYAPRITTPLQLEQKLGDLVSYLKERSQEKIPFIDLSKI